MMLIRIFNISYTVITIKYVKIVDAEILSVKSFRVFYVYSDWYVFVSAFKRLQEWQRKCIVTHLTIYQAKAR
jgi:hypothetical protein